jgi:hypothetical protein
MVPTEENGQFSQEGLEEGSVFMSQSSMSVISRNKEMLSRKESTLTHNEDAVNMIDDEFDHSVVSQTLSRREVS